MKRLLNNLKRKMDSERVARQRIPKLFEINKVILIGCMVGLLATVYERNTGIGHLGSNLDTIWHLEVEGFRNDLLAMTKALLAIVILIKAFTKEIYVACYVVMVYAYSGGSKSVTLPWLILCGIRSIILETISCFAGCVICAHYRQLKIPCVDFVITKAVCLACSTFLWSVVYETYMNESRNPTRQRRETAPALTSRERSLDSVLAEAIVDWFLEEAERCQRFDSKLAVDQDIVKFEDELADRAAKFLELTPEEILREAKLKGERKHPFTRKHCSTQTKESKTDISRDSVELDLNIERIERNQSDTESVTSIIRLSPKTNQPQRISSLDMENKNPLRRFAYFPHIVESESSNEIVGDITVGNKSTSVQTIDEKTEEDDEENISASLL